MLFKIIINRNWSRVNNKIWVQITIEEKYAKKTWTHEKLLRMKSLTVVDFCKLVRFSNIELDDFIVSAAGRYPLSQSKTAESLLSKLESGPT